MKQRLRSINFWLNILQVYSKRWIGRKKYIHLSFAEREREWAWCRSADIVLEWRGKQKSWHRVNVAFSSLIILGRKRVALFSFCENQLLSCSIHQLWPFWLLDYRYVPASFGFPWECQAGPMRMVSTTFYFFFRYLQTEWFNMKEFQFFPINLREKLCMEILLLNYFELLHRRVLDNYPKKNRIRLKFNFSAIEIHY